MITKMQQLRAVRLPSFISFPPLSQTIIFDRDSPNNAQRKPSTLLVIDHDGAAAASMTGRRPDLGGARQRRQRVHDGRDGAPLGLGPRAVGTVGAVAVVVGMYDMVLGIELLYGMYILTFLSPRILSLIARTVLFFFFLSQ